MADTQGSSSGSNKTKASVGASKGSSVLPQARVNRIVKSDKDIAMCSKEALFLISVATVRLLSEQA